MTGYRGKLYIGIGSLVIGLTLLWDRFIQFALWYLEKFGHPDQRLGVYAQIALVIGLGFLGRGIYLIGREAKEMTDLVDSATKPEKK